MPEIFKRTIAILPPVDAPADLATHFAALESADGWVQWFTAVDTVTGEQFLVRFVPHGQHLTDGVPMQ